MAHIVEIAIAKLVGRKDIYRKKLNRDVNVFYGLNGSGKTSLLKILDSAMSGDTSSIISVPFESAEVTIHSVDYQRNYVRSISKTHTKEKAKKIFPPQQRIDRETSYRLKRLMEEIPRSLQ